VRATYEEYFLKGNWLDGPLLPHKPLTKGPFFPPDRFYRTVFSGPFLPGPFLLAPLVVVSNNLLVTLVTQKIVIDRPL